MPRKSNDEPVQTPEDEAEQLDEIAPGGLQGANVDPESAEENENIKEPEEMLDPWAGLGVYDPFDEEEAPGDINAAIYGQPGSGKTWLAATAPNPLHLDLERGGKATIKTTGNRAARSVHIKNLNHLRKIYRALLTTEHPYQSVILDPIGSLQSLIMEDTIRKWPDVKRQYNDLPTMADWNKALTDATKLITAFRALPIHTILVAHADEPQHEDDMVTLLASGKNFKPFLQGAMDLLGYLYTELDDDGETVRLLRTVSSATVVAKNRGGHLPSIMTNPNMTEIIKMMGGKV